MIKRDMMGLAVPPTALCPLVSPLGCEFLLIFQAVMASGRHTNKNQEAKKKKPRRFTG